MFDSITNFFNNDLAIDFGTGNTLVYGKGHGIVSNEASFVAVHKNGPNRGQIAGFGTRAKEIRGKTSANITSSSPFKGGSIHDFELAKTMLRHFIKQIPGRSSYMKGKVLIGIPTGATELDRRKVIEAAKLSEAGRVYTVEEGIAAAIGCGLPIHRACGSMLIDMGAGTTDVTVISLDGVVHAESVATAGNSFDNQIADFVRKKYNVLIGDQTAERIKKTIGSATEIKEKKESLTVQGQSIAGGMPTNVVVTQSDVLEAIRDSLREIVFLVQKVLDVIPPEIASDLMDRGAYLVGGSSLLNNVDMMLSEQINLPVRLVEDPYTAGITGSGKILEDWEKYKHLLGNI